MFELKNLWVSFSKLFQDTQPSQVKTLSFHMALYVRIYPCHIIYIHSFQSNTLLHIQTPSS